MPTFRTRPAVVDARQFRATSAGAQEVIDWINLNTGYDPRQGGNSPVMYYYGDLTIRTGHGDLHATNGDYIVRNAAGQFHVYKAHAFELMYEPTREDDT